MSKNGNENIREQALRIMEALSGVDEELLVRCDEAAEGREGSRESGAGVLGESGRRRRASRPRRRPVWRLAGPCAAALCLALVGIVSWRNYWLMKGTGSDSSGGSMMQKNDMVCNENGYGVGAVQEDEKEGGSLEVLPEDTDGGNWEQQKMSDVSGKDVDSAEIRKDADGNGQAQNGAAQNGAENFMTGNYGMEGAGKEESGDQDASDIAFEEGGMLTDGCLKLNSIEYTEQEARRLEGLGEYVPEALPEGYVFQRAYSNQDLERENLTISWSRGMDLILLHLEWVQGTVETVDTDKPETFDQRLYEVPYGETVPDEYQQVFQDPMFALEDLSLEIIESRMLVYEDRGDTATPRGHFRVLYPDGVLASFNGRGTAQEIWEMFSSMKH